MATGKGEDDTFGARRPHSVRLIEPAMRLSGGRHGSEC
jgi:hypothetical protein